MTTVTREQSFCIKSNIHVTVTMYETSDEQWKMTSWLNGVKELNTKDIDEDIDSLSNDEIIAMMEGFIYENEDYILSVAKQDNN